MERMVNMSLERLSPEDRLLLERLLSDPEINFTEQQLQDMLDEELSKPTEEINMGLIDDIVYCLNPGEVSKEEINRGLEKLMAALREQSSNE